jgi:hypothetical protein
MFARSWKIWDWNYTASAYDTATGDAAPNWDFRSALAGKDTAPAVFGVNSTGGRCMFGEEGTCVQTAENGLTLVRSGSPEESHEAGKDLVDDTTGRMSVKIRYYARANKDQMPLRRMVFDFGDGKVMDSGAAYYKNHLGATDPNANKTDVEVNAETRSNQLTKICGSLDQWGLTDDSCDPRYFEQSKTYVCSYPYRDGLEICAAAGDTDKEFYPCQDAQGRCVFRPRVQFTDNWGFCNGTCASRVGGACFNPDLDEPAAEENDCAILDFKNNPKPSEKAPWTWAFGKIRISPQ